MKLSTSQLNQLAWSIDADGFLPHEDEAIAVAVQAQATGVDSAVIGVLADRSSPAPVRERAFGQVVIAMARAEAAASPDWALAN